MSKRHDLHLTDEEREILVATLRSALSDLSYEIGDTDSYDFRQELKAKRDTLNKVIEQLERS